MKRILQVGLLLCVCSRSAVCQETSPLKYAEGKELAKLADPAINESSGVAAGRTNPGVLWTHNDSGGKPQVFAFSMAGEALATITVTGAAARDWEDLASFSVNGRSVLLVADVGDNNAKRGVYALYAFREPRLKPRKRGVRAAVKRVKTISFKYEDGPHNCESVGVDPTDRTIYLVSKEAGNKCQVYSLAWPKRSRRAPHVAKAIATLEVPTTTAMDISRVSGDIILFSLTEGWDTGIVLTYATNPTSRYAGEGSGPRPAARQTRPEPEAEGVISMMSPDSDKKGDKCEKGD